MIGIKEIWLQLDVQNVNESFLNTKKLEKETCGIAGRIALSEIIAFIKVTR